MSEPLIIIIILFLFALYLVIDFGVISSGNINSFMDKWVVKTLWIWLPVYGIWRLAKEVILKKKNGSR